MKLGIVANEFFDETLGRMGGFGWAARQVARCFLARPNLGVDVVFLAAGIKSHIGLQYTRVHDTLFIFGSTGEGYRNLIGNERVDLILTIDYRPRYRGVLEVLHEVPTIVWIRDPWTASVHSRVATLRIPGDKLAPPQGIRAKDCTSLAKLAVRRPNRSPPVMFATPAPSLGQFVQSTYGVPWTTCAFLPNVVDTTPEPINKHREPLVVFVGRLDPIKRPWVFVEIAQRFPRVQLYARQVALSWAG